MMIDVLEKLSIPDPKTYAGASHATKTEEFRFGQGCGHEAVCFHQFDQLRQNLAMHLGPPSTWSHRAEVKHRLISFHAQYFKILRYVSYAFVIF